MTKIDEKALELSDQLKADLGEIELRAMQYSLADAIREGSTVSKQASGTFGTGDTACALSAAFIAAKARGWR